MASYPNIFKIEYSKEEGLTTYQMVPCPSSPSLASMAWQRIISSWSVGVEDWVHGG